MRTFESDYKDIMPLLMGFTTPSPIDVTEPVKVSYNEQEQISYDLRMVGTRCLRPNATAPKAHCYTKDKKNEIDDSKSVR